MPPIDVESENSVSEDEVPVRKATPKQAGRTPKETSSASRPSRKAARKPAADEIEDEDAMDEDEEVEVIPVRKSSRSKAAADAMDEDEKDEGVENGDDDEDDEEEEDEEIFIVEKIITHQFDAKGVLLYQVKWKGYEKKSDLTWEPTEHLLEGASECLDEYHDKIGGVPEFTESAAKRKAGRPRKTETPTSSVAKGTPPTTGRGGQGTDAESLPKKRRGRPPKAETPKSIAPTTTVTRKGKESGSHSASPMVVQSSKAKWTPPVGSWEGHIQAVDTIEQDESGLHVYLQWNDGRKTRHPLEITYQKCPQRMLHFYEQHLVFKEGEAQPSPNGSLQKEDEDEEL